MRLVLLGAPGAGKGTQGQRLAKVLDVPEISTGDLLRAAVEAGTPLGRAAKSVMDAGQLVSDDIVLGVIRERLAQPDVRDGFILDGFPRNVAQAEALDELLAQIGQPIELVLLINVDTDWLLQRLVGRRTCVSCGAMYNIFSAPPKMDDRCDECGGRLRQRADDNEETIGNRLRIYDTQTAPLIQRYRESGRLRTVSGVGSVDDVFRAVMKVVEEERANRKVPDRADVIRSAIVRQQTVAKTRRAKTPKPAPQASADTGSGAGATTVPAATTAAKPKTPAKPKTAAKPKAAKSGAKAPTKPAAATGTAAKKTGAAKTAASGTTAKKAAGKKAPGKPAAPAKATAKKPTAKKTAPAKKAAKKSATKTAPAKKSAAKAKRKAAAKKAPAKSAARKKAAKKTGTRKTATRKAPARKAPARKTAAKKAPAKKAAAKKGAAGKKSAARRSASGAKKRR